MSDPRPTIPSPVPNSHQNSRREFVPLSADLATDENLRVRRPPDDHFSKRPSTSLIEGTSAFRCRKFGGGPKIGRGGVGRDLHSTIGVPDSQIGRVCRSRAEAMPVGFRNLQLLGRSRLLQVSSATTCAAPSKSASTCSSVAYRTRRNNVAPNPTTTATRITACQPSKFQRMDLNINQVSLASPGHNEVCPSFFRRLET